jgi:hypothetical protein
MPMGDVAVEGREERQSAVRRTFNYVVYTAVKVTVSAMASKRGGRVQGIWWMAGGAGH